MLVPITSDGAAPDGVRQWAMIELQGEVERKDGGSLEEAFDVGTLSVTSTVRLPAPPPSTTPLPVALCWCSAATWPGDPQQNLALWLQGDTVLLNIGYHQLEGKRLPLKKPLAVLEKNAEPSRGVGYKVRLLAGCPGCPRPCEGSSRSQLPARC